jgi:hypothetical protein
MLGHVGGFLPSSTLKAPPYNQSLSKYTNQLQAWNLNLKESIRRGRASSAKKLRKKRIKRWDMMIDTKKVISSNAMQQSTNSGYIHSLRREQES